MKKKYCTTMDCFDWTDTNYVVMYLSNSWAY